MPRALVALALTLACGSRREPPAVATERPATRSDRDGGATAAPASPRATEYPHAAAALEVILATRPRVIGFGEVHAVEDGPPVASAIERFTAMLDTLGPRLSDLVIETWISEGTCGKAEAKIQKDVPQQTARPAETENQLVHLATRARTLGVQPQALTLSCKDYESLVGQGEAVDYQNVLALLTRELLRVSYAAVHARDADAKSRPIVAVYGGAIHNDLHPPEETRAWSYATQLAAQVPGYVEVDLYVPELVKGHPLVAKEPWLGLLDRAAPGKVLLIERAPRSYVLLLEKGVAPARRGK